MFEISLFLTFSFSTPLKSCFYVPGLMLSYSWDQKVNFIAPLGITAKVVVTHLKNLIH